MERRMQFRLVLAVMSTIMTLPRLARADRVAIMPATAEVEFRAYGFGMLPLDGRFSRFRGSLEYDRKDRSRCAAQIEVQLDSLSMDQSSLRDDVLGPDIMDAARFPVMKFEGACKGTNLEGTLTVHGVARPFTMGLDWTPRSAMAEGSLRRNDWGMSGRPFLAGPTVRIKVSVPLPP